MLPFLNKGKDVRFLEACALFQPPRSPFTREKPKLLRASLRQRDSALLHGCQKFNQPLVGPALPEDTVQLLEKLAVCPRSKKRRPARTASAVLATPATTSDESL